MTQIVLDISLLHTAYRSLVESDPTDLDEDFEPTLDDNKLQEMQDQLDTLTNNGGDIEEARVFLKETKTFHLETREKIGVLLRQML